MSFDVNVGRARPMINPASKMGNNGGSGGNTGYMNRRKRRNQNNSIFDSNNYGALNPYLYSDMAKDFSYMKDLGDIRQSWLYNCLQFIKTKILSGKAYQT